MDAFNCHLHSKTGVQTPAKASDLNLAKCGDPQGSGVLLHPTPTQVKLVVFGF